MCDAGLPLRSDPESLRRYGLLQSLQAAFSRSQQFPGYDILYIVPDAKIWSICASHIRYPLVPLVCLRAASTSCACQRHVPWFAVSLPNCVIRYSPCAALSCSAQTTLNLQSTVDESDAVAAMLKKRLLEKTRFEAVLVQTLQNAKANEAMLQQQLGEEKTLCDQLGGSTKELELHVRVCDANRATGLQVLAVTEPT